MEHPTYRDLQRYASYRLKHSGCESAHFVTMNLMTHCFQLERADLILKKEERPSREKVEAFKSLVERCAGGEPLQYILGEWEFMGLPFTVGPGVLIPRPETELLVDTALRLLRRMKGKEHPVVYDLCTGSGAVAVSVATYWKNASVYALELSPEALSFAKGNIYKNGAAAVQLRQWDVLAGPQGAGLPEADLILSNPPYIRSGELPGLQRQVQREPAMALDGGEDGLKFYRAVKELWLPALSPSGALVLECGSEQGGALEALFEGSFVRSGVEKDISGLDRIYWGMQSWEPEEMEPF